MNFETLWKLKYHADSLNVILPFLFFIIGVYPLLEKRPEKDELNNFVQRLHFKIEFLASIGLIATLIIYLLNYFASSPLYSKGECLKLKKQIEFSQFKKIQNHKKRVLRIESIGDDVYLVSNSKKYYYELNMTKDYKFIKTKCF